MAEDKRIPGLNAPGPLVPATDQAAVYQQATDSTVRMPISTIIAAAGGVQNNYGATTDPTASNDDTQGYAVGSNWINTTNNTLYTAVDVTTGAAVWQLQGGGVGVQNNFTATVNPAVGNDSSQGYAIGSVWINTATNAVFTATDVTVGAAVWTSGAGAPGGQVDSIAASADIVVDNTDPINPIPSFSPARAAERDAGISNVVDEAGLKGIATVNLAVGFQRTYRDAGGNLLSYKLDAGTDAESSPTILRPDDYAATTNEKVWRQATTPGGNGVDRQDAALAALRAQDPQIAGETFQLTDTPQEGQFFYDPTDTTTADDGIDVIVTTANNRRLKRVKLGREELAKPNNLSELAFSGGKARRSPLADIAARNALTDIGLNEKVLVQDASVDVNITSGWAWQRWLNTGVSGAYIDTDFETVSAENAVNTALNVTDLQTGAAGVLTDFLNKIGSQRREGQLEEGYYNLENADYSVPVDGPMILKGRGDAYTYIRGAERINFADDFQIEDLTVFGLTTDAATRASFQSNSQVLDKSGLVRNVRAIGVPKLLNILPGANNGTFRKFIAENVEAYASLVVLNLRQHIKNTRINGIIIRDPDPDFQELIRVGDSSGNVSENVSIESVSGYNIMSGNPNDLEASSPYLIICYAFRVHASKINAVNINVPGFYARSAESVLRDSNFHMPNGSGTVVPLLTFKAGTPQRVVYENNIGGVPAVGNYFVGQTSGMSAGVISTGGTDLQFGDIRWPGGGIVNWADGEQLVFYTDSTLTVATGVTADIQAGTILTRNYGGPSIVDAVTVTGRNQIVFFYTQYAKLKISNCAWEVENDGVDMMQINPDLLCPGVKIESSVINNKSVSTTGGCLNYDTFEPEAELIISNSFLKAPLNVIDKTSSATPNIPKRLIIENGSTVVANHGKLIAEDLSNQNSLAREVVLDNSVLKFASGRPSIWVDAEDKIYHRDAIVEANLETTGTQTINGIIQYVAPYVNINNLTVNVQSADLWNNECHIFDAEHIEVVDSNYNLHTTTASRDIFTFENGITGSKYDAIKLLKISGITIDYRATFNSATYNAVSEFCRFENTGVQVIDELIIEDCILNVGNIVNFLYFQGGYNIGKLTVRNCSLPPGSSITNLLNDNSGANATIGEVCFEGNSGAIPNSFEAPVLDTISFLNTGTVYHGTDAAARTASPITLPAVTDQMEGNTEVMVHNAAALTINNADVTMGTYSASVNNFLTFYVIGGRRHVVINQE